jgi:chromosome segregation ATPase
MERHAVDEAALAPLVGLVERLRGEVTELQGRWEALGEELEAKRQRLRLAEATVEMIKRREEEALQEEKDLEHEEAVSQAAQASRGKRVSASRSRGMLQLVVKRHVLERLLLTPDSHQAIARRRSARVWTSSRRCRLACGRSTSGLLCPSRRRRG